MGKVQNREALAVTELRQHALAIIEAGLAALETSSVIRSAVTVEREALTLAGTSYPLTSFRNLYVLGVGKCAYDAARELEQILGERIHRGLVIDVRDGGELTHIEARVGTHPYASDDNVRHTEALLELARGAGEEDLVIVIISGGGSALLTDPFTHTVEDEQRLIKHLFSRGATIRELNIVRKHLSKARGGGLAAAAAPAKVVALLFSDVPGDDVETISSAPTLIDQSTVADAAALLGRYGAEEIGFSASHLHETPKDTELFSQVRSELILTNKTALEAMERTARALGYAAAVKSTHITGEARSVAYGILESLRTGGDEPVAHLYGGETTVTIGGSGEGGRNEELSLAALERLMDDELVVSIASDGRDNTAYAGGIADAHTRALAAEANLAASDFLARNDSYTFFHTLRQGVDTGYTGSNVADLMVALKHPV